MRVEHERRGDVDDARLLAAEEIVRDELLVRDRDDICERSDAPLAPAGRRFAKRVQQGFFALGGALEPDGQVDHRDVVGWDADAQSRKLARQLGQDERDRFARARAGRDDVLSDAAACGNIESVRESLPSGAGTTRP